ncbi:MAG TPA: translation initiation factor IF-2 N-terminal domain-containing protein, partial [Acidobacteriaceae bacterium]
MSKVRINDLARELEVKSRAILDVLQEVGVTDPKTHSSSLEGDEAQRVRAHFQRGNGRNGSASAKSESGTTQKIDWSRVSKPGDVLKAIQQRKEEAERPAPRPQAAPPAAAAKPAPPATPAAASAAPAAPASAAPAAPKPEPPAPPRRIVVPQPRQAPPIVTAPPPQAPAI